MPRNDFFIKFVRFGTPLTVSLVSLPPPATGYQEALDRETVPEMAHADLPVQQFQSHPESTRSIENERKPEAEPDLKSKEKGGPGQETPDGNSLETDAAQSMDMETAYHIAQAVVGIPEFEAGLVLKSKSRGVFGPEVPAGKTLVAGTPPSIDLEAAYSIAREIGRASMTEFELQELRFKSRELS